MECNKDEAMRAKDIAVRKFTERDFAGAKKFALKAQYLYNGIEGITQMIAAIEVYISAENKLNGESDMYGILGVIPIADDETIKKQYRRLLLQLHPDKNNFIGADGAFQHVTQAFNLLSDKAKRAAYNNRHNIKTLPSQSSAPTWPTGSCQFQPKFPTHSGRTADQKVPSQGGVFGDSSSSQRKVNGFHNPPSFTSSRGRATKSNKRQKTSPIQSFLKKENTFWTKCYKCLMQYEYMRVYLNQILKCPHCQEGFEAVEVPPPSNISAAFTPQHRKPTTAYNSADYSISVAGKAANGQVLDREKAKRDYEAALAAAKRERNGDPGFVLRGEGPAKKAREMDDYVNYYGGGIPNKTDFCSKMYNSGRELLAMELRKMLSEKALIEIRQKLEEWKLAKEAKIASKEKQKSKQKEKQNSKLENDVATSPLFDDAKDEAAEMMTMSVPDPDFHVFDTDRSEGCFAGNQVWAAYDSDDGMPRFYAMIQKVISANPFKVRLSWLESKNNAEFGPLDWEDRGLVKSCGKFLVGKPETNTSLNSFSHKVRWVKGQRGVIQIYPGKGEMWALYRNWSADWNKDTPEDIIHQYDMVEVLDDYNEKKGVHVAPIVKATGFLNVFCKQPEPKEIKLIPREEMFRFSHQVPSYELTGEEGPNAPKGHVELDPASTPSDLLHKVTTPGINGPTTGTGSIVE